ncbi:MAG: GntR family transcriptional regulator [Verrucomicrobiae bacterium]|nr:GntR family transcriptional regulator [Verrucomicrobiae bacterium]
MHKIFTKVKSEILPRPNGESHYVALKKILKTQILTGKLSPGRQIPTEGVLCHQYGISRNTVRRAILDLVQEGLLSRHRKRGTVVNLNRLPSQQNLLGMIFSKTDSHPGGIEQIIQGAQDTAREEGFQLVCLNPQHDACELLNMAIQLNQLKTMGTLFMPICGIHGTQANNEALAILHGAGQKVVLIDSEATGPLQDKVSSVTSKNFEGSYQLTNHLISLGYTRIAFLKGPAPCVSAGLKMS